MERFCGCYRYRYDSLFIIQVLRSKGCGKIIAVDTDPVKRNLALQLGADHAFDPGKQDIKDEILLLTSVRELIMFLRQWVLNQQFQLPSDR